MSIKIYHGPNGAYKTASAINNDFVAAIKEGRPLVTNVRGVTLDRIYDAIDDAPKDLNLTVIDTGTAKGRQQALTWWHWAPQGAFILFDEAQALFPQRLRPTDLEKLNYKTQDEAESENRPCVWEDAWDMHRHYGWDIILTTPKIKKIRDDIRGTTEMAIKHKNLAIFGTFFKGNYIQSWHMAEDTGENENDILNKVKQKLTKNSICWKLYESTKTGDIKDTKNTFNLFASPKIAGLLIFLLCIFIFLFRDGKPQILASQSKQTTSAALPTNHSSNQQKSEILPQASNSTIPDASNLASVRYTYQNYVDLNDALNKPILNGCIETKTDCICYTVGGFRFNVNKFHCSLIMKNGFYREPQKPIEAKITNAGEERSSRESNEPALEAGDFVPEF